MARPPAQPPRSPLKPFYVILGVIALVGLGVLGYALLSQEQPTTEPVAVALTDADLNRVQGISVGQEDAPVVLMEFADFQCPGCGQFATFIAPLVKERLVKSGQVRYVYYDFPLMGLHQHAFLASRAGRCANEQGRFWEMHDILYGQQPQWSQAQDPTELFVQYARQAGADPAKFEACLRSDRYAREVTESMKLGEKLGVRGTPTLFVNGKRVTETPGTYRELESIVLAEAGGGAADSTAAGVDSLHAH